MSSFEFAKWYNNMNSTPLTHINLQIEAYSKCLKFPEHAMTSIA